MSVRMDAATGRHARNERALRRDLQLLCWLLCYELLCVYEYVAPRRVGARRGSVMMLKDVCGCGRRASNRPGREQSACPLRMPLLEHARQRLPMTFCMCPFG
jgi:hypothetical protein